MTNEAHHDNNDSKNNNKNNKVSDAFVDTAVTVGKRATWLTFGTAWASITMQSYEGPEASKTP